MRKFSILFILLFSISIFAKGNRQDDPSYQVDHNRTKNFTPTVHFTQDQIDRVSDIFSGMTGNTFTINSDLGNVTSKLIFGRTTGGNGEISHDGYYIRFNKDGSIDRRAGANTTLRMDAPTDYDNNIIFYEEGSLRWLIRYDSSADRFEIYSYILGSYVLRSSDEGDITVVGNLSALSFTDRTPFFEGDAISEIMQIKGKDGEIDHSSLPSFARKEITKQRFEDVELTTEVDAKDAYTYDTRTIEVKGVEQEEIIEDSKRLKDTVYEDEKTGKFYEKYSVGEVKIKDGKPYQNIDVGEEIEQGRDLGAMISMLTVAVQQLKNEINELKKQRG